MRLASIAIEELPQEPDVVVRSRRMRRQVATGSSMGHDGLAELGDLLLQ
jgi:hypothetical protein